MASEFQNITPYQSQELNVSYEGDPSAIQATSSGGLSQEELTEKYNNKKYNPEVDPGVGNVVGDLQAINPSISGTNPQQTSSNIVSGDPSAFFNSDMSLSDQENPIDPNTQGTEIDSSEYFMDTDGVQGTTEQASTETAQEANPQNAATYDPTTTQEDVKNAAMEGAQGEVSEGAQIDADEQTIDTEEQANKEYLNDYANIDVSRVIDTSTVSGQLLADELGQGNYVDKKATLQGQMDILSRQFEDAAGNPKIPTWAAGTARSVSKIAAFSGMSGSAATAAMSQAIMEASIPIAQQDAQFFQTATMKNLDNQQQSIINKANVLSNMEMANLDARMTAAVENSKNFMQMDLANLNNEQQARVINTQSRVQSILEDAKAQNAAKKFNTQSQNEMDQFYEQLNSNIRQFNASQKNSMEQFNTSESNSMEQFNAELENQREQYYQQMQYNIDQSNAEWRRNVTLKNDEQAFQAAAQDVQNIVGLSVEELNQLWDRSDALLDYAWKTSEGAKDRDAGIAKVKIDAASRIKAARIRAEAAESGGIGGVFGQIAGSVLGDIF